MNGEFWRDKRVFLTGHTGFKGSWLSLWLHRLGARVQGYALAPPTVPSLFELAGVEGCVQSMLADIRDHARLSHELAAFEPDIVLHLAAQSVVLESYTNPVETFSTNVIGTANVLDSVRRMSRPCAVVNVTTDKVYENRHWVWGYRENDRLGGRDPYSSSKACAEFVARAFRDSFFAAPADPAVSVGVASARAGNVIGGGDWTPWQLVPDTIRALQEGRPVVLRHPEAIRPWQHVLDCLSGYLMLAEALHGNASHFGGEWNFGPADADASSVSHVVEALAGHWKQMNPWIRSAEGHAHEETELRLNSQKAARELGWQCRLDLSEALAWTAEWFRGQEAGDSARVLCERQMERYMQLPKDRRTDDLPGA
jgi:CDP-glucose 4,6-dehydratase